MINKNILNELSEIEKINIEKVEAKFGTDYILTTKHNMAYNCPYCESKRGKADTDHKFMVDCKTTLYWCFKCHTKGLLIKNHISNSEKLVPYLFDYFNISENESKNNSKLELGNNLLEFNNVIDIDKNSLAYEYLQKRKITDEQINYYNLKNGINEHFGRIMIPNVLVANWTDFYQGRAYLDFKNKYENPEGVDKTNIVFNLHNQKKNQDKVYIVEGIFSAIRGGKDCLSIFGSSVSNVQVERIKRYNFKEIYCCLDGDSAGQLGNKQLANELQNETDSKIWVVKLPEKEDPADLGEDLFKEYCEEYKYEFIDNKMSSIFSYFN